MTVFLPIISGKLFSNEAQEHFFSDISSNRKKKVCTEDHEDTIEENVVGMWDYSFGDRKGIRL